MQLSIGLRKNLLFWHPVGGTRSGLGRIVIQIVRAVALRFGAVLLATLANANTHAQL